MLKSKKFLCFYIFNTNFALTKNVNCYLQAYSGYYYSKKRFSKPSESISTMFENLSSTL